MASPREEEYSRVTDPERYRVVQARGQVWTAVLRELPGVGVGPVAPGALDRGDSPRRFDRGVRLASDRQGTLPLLLLEQDVPLSAREGSLPRLHVSVGEAEAVVQALPYCGCDACDSGSDDLLEALDETVGRLVGGPFVQLRGEGWQASWYPDGGSSGGSGPACGLDHDELMALCGRLADGEEVRLPERTDVLVGRSWLA